MSSSSLDDLWNKALDFAGGKTPGDTKGTHPYFAPSDEPLSWDTKGKMMRLDVAIYAVHIYAARIAFRSISGLTKQKSIGFLRGIATWAGKKAIAKLGGAVVNGLLASVQIIRDQVRAEDTQKAVEQAIRRQSLKVQRDCLANVLGAGKPKRRRRVQEVWSRHETPRQRRPNKSWHP